MIGEETAFRTEEPLLVTPRRMTAVRLSLDGPPLKGVVSSGPGIRFETIGWYEVLLAVQWDPHDETGTRFAHTRIPGQEPLHSEAINAAVLLSLSGGRQLLRGNTIFGLDHTEEIVLEDETTLPDLVAPARRHRRTRTEFSVARARSRLEDTPS
jgi:hypothetical protein